MLRPLQRLESILDNSGVGVWQWHVLSGSVTTNEAFHRIVGCAAEMCRHDMGKSPWLERIHPDDLAAVTAQRKRLLAGEIDAYTIDYRVLNEADDWNTLRDRASVIERDAEGNTLWVAGVVIDVSYEREMNRRFRALMDRPFQFIGLLTPEGVLIETNTASVESTGNTMEEVLGKLFWETAFFQGLPSVQQQLKDGVARAAAGECVRFEIFVPRPGGLNTTVDFTLTPLRNDDGRVVNIIPEGRDISDMVRAREALRITESRLELATAGANLGIWEWDCLAGQIWRNDQWWRMLGYEPGEISPEYASFMALCHPDDIHELHRRREAHIQGRTSGFRVDLRLRHKDGSWRQLLVRGHVSERDAEGRVLRIVGVNEDVTERRELEIQLAAAQRLEAIGHLAAGVAHEINTPVQYITDSVYFVREAVNELLALMAKAGIESSTGTAGENDIQYLQEHLPQAMERSIEGLARVSEIVRSMKEFSHPDQHDMAPIDLNHTIQNTLTVARSEYKYVAEIETQLCELPLVVCHGGKLSQLLVNLIVNAAHAIADVVKDTGQKGVITVSTRLADEDVVIDVADTGGGIPESVRSRVFDPFFTTKGVGRGTGQGLTLVHNVVKQHGGTVSFETEVGRGTRFSVRLPLVPPIALCEGQVA